MSEPAQTPAEQAGAQTAQFKGETYRINQDVSEWAFMEFAEAASEGQDANTLQGMASLLRFVLELVHPDERDAFRAHARKSRASTDDLLEFLLGKPAADAERPTGRSSDSSDGPTSTAPKPAANSDGSGSAVTGLALLRTRPDLALIVHEARQAS
jgi:hypothetical protein